MNINIRGTSGSGKSTIVKTVMDLYGDFIPIFRQGRRQPISYVNEVARLAVVGHYETACGGCDTITSLDEVYDVVRQFDTMGIHTLFEGIMVSGESRRAVDLNKTSRGGLYVIGLDVPIEECIAGIMKRRKERGDDKPFDPERTIRRQGEVTRMMEHLKIGGVTTEWLDREWAYYRVLELVKKGNES